MKKLIQTRLHNPPETLGNCFSTVISCLMDLNSAEDVIQIQEYYEKDNWYEILHSWLETKGYYWYQIQDHLFDNTYYLVTGKSPRNPNINHVCIYKNGKLFHDPHPDNTGVLSEDYFEIITKEKLL